MRFLLYVYDYSVLIKWSNLFITQILSDKINKPPSRPTAHFQYNVRSYYIF